MSDLWIVQILEFSGYRHTATPQPSQVMVGVLLAKQKRGHIGLEISDP